MVEKTKNYQFYCFSFYLLIISAIACMALWLVLFIFPNISIFFLINFIVFTIIGAFMLLVGTIQSIRNDLNLKDQFSFKPEKIERNKALKFLLFAAFFSILIGLPALIGISILYLMNIIVYGWYSAMGIPGLASGVFLISIFGNFTVVFPVPYTFALVSIGLAAPTLGLNYLDFIIIAIMAGLGASIGELSAWLLGRSQAETVEDSGETGQQFLKLKEQIDKGYGGLLVFLYAATPLPDDVLLIALGATKYNPLKLILWCFLGKVVLCALALFGAGFLAGIMGPDSNPLIETLWMVIGIGIILLLIYVDWEAILQSIKKILQRIRKILQKIKRPKSSITE